jgi:hypothetical protein
LSGRRCPNCNESKGERRTREVLLSKGIPYRTQHTFNDLLGTGRGLLKYDVSVFKDKRKRKLWFLIEYDGVFHYEKQYDLDGFKTLKIHDKLKDMYCKEHNIPLLRIPYWEFDNIEFLLTNFIDKLKE